MSSKEKFKPTQPSKIKCLLLLGILSSMYILENLSFFSFNKGMIFKFIVIPILWCIVVGFVWLLPRIRAKSKLKYRGLINCWALIFAVLYIAIAIFAGFIIDGFGKSPYDHSFAGIIVNIIYVGAALVGREFVRSYLANSLTKKGNFLIFILIALFMTVISISFNRYIKIEGNVELVEFMAQYFVPEFSQNLFSTYLVFLGGPLTSIIYLGIVQGFHWFSPILPNLKWITTALVGVLSPVFFLMLLESIYLKETKQLKRIEEQDTPVKSIITCVIAIGIIWFSVGVFPISPSVIATGSMEPFIKPGDVILVKKIEVDDIKIDDIIQFERGNILISHRVVGIVEEDNTIGYQTKGDNNSSPDIEIVKQEEVRGKVIKVVPKIGWPTLFIKSKKDVPLEEIEF
ncbi:signal peptidase I [Clostridium sp. DL1XJH146]